MTRPLSIVLFERLYLASIGLAAVEAVLVGGSEVPNAPAAFTLAVEFTVMLCLAALALVASRRGSRLARLGVAAIFAAALPFSVARMAPFHPTLPNLLDVAQDLLDAVAVCLLFLPVTKAWFAPKP